jgi:hypothetical protein
MRTKVPRLATLAFIVCAACATAYGAVPQTPAASAAAQQFTVLRTGHFNAGAETLASSDANCWIAGTSSAATMQCQRAGKSTGSYHFNTALVVDASGMAYVIACRVPLVLVLCRKLEPGIMVEGQMDGAIMALTDGNKVRRYQILATANIGPLPPGQAPPPKSTATTRSEAPPAAPVSSSRPGNKPESPPIAVAPTDASAACASPTGACVTFVSDPPGADIYVDGKFMGDTPSMIIVPAGSHQIRVEAEKFTPWSRTFEASAGNKVTIRATLQSQPPTK